MMTPALLAKLAMDNPELLASALAAKGIAPPQDPIQLASAVPPTESATAFYGNPQPAMAPQARLAPQGPMGGGGGAPAPGGAVVNTPPMPGGQMGVPPTSLGDAIAGVKPSIAATRPYAAAVAPGGANFAASGLGELLALIMQNQQTRPQLPPSLGSLIGG